MRAPRWRCRASSVATRRPMCRGTTCSALVVADEPFLADGELLYLGQPVAVVAATSPQPWRRAARRCGLIVSGRADSGFDRVDSPQEVSGPAAADCARRRRREFVGSRRIGSAACSPAAGRSSSIWSRRRPSPIRASRGRWSSTRRRRIPTEIQAVVAEMLGVGHHEVVCICKRMGGAFGGKESQAAIPAMMAALVAHKTGRPARVIYNKDDDMRVTGKRHAYRSEWEVGFDDDGRIQALRVAYYSNGGASTDLSLAVMERIAAAHRQLLFPAARGADRAGVLHEPAVEHGVSRLRRAAGDGGDREYFGIDRPAAGNRCVRRADAKLVRRRRAKCHAVRPAVRQESFAGNLRHAGGPIAVPQTARGSGSVQRHVAHSRARAGDDRREVRHLVHDQVSEPGQRAGEHLHGRHGASFDRRDRDGPGREREDPAAGGRRVWPRRRAASC